MFLIPETLQIFLCWLRRSSCSLVGTALLVLLPWVDLVFVLKFNFLFHLLIDEHLQQLEECNSRD